MAEENIETVKNVKGPNIILAVILGLVLGFLLSGLNTSGSASDYAKPLAMGLIASFGLVYLCGLVKQLAAMPDKIQGTEVSADHLGEIFGKAVDEAFKANVPQPEKMAQAVEQVIKSTTESTRKNLEELNQKLSESQKTILEGLQKADKDSAGILDEARKALKELADDTTKAAKEISTSITKGHEAGSKQLTDMLQKHSAEIDKSIQKHVSSTEKVVGEISDGIQGGYASGVQQMTGALQEHLKQAEANDKAALDGVKNALTEHAASLKKSSEQIAGQLDKIMQLEKDIQQVLHVQEAVDGTLKTVMATEEFKSTMDMLRKHLEEGDKLLKEISKPRKIRLVEQDREITQTS